MKQMILFVLSLFPPYWRDKMLMAGNVLFHNWSVHPFPPALIELQKISENDIEQKFYNLDEESKNVIKEYVNLSKISRPENPELFFYNFSHFSFSKYMKMRNEAAREQKRFHKKYHIPMNGGSDACETAFYFLHGLNLLPVTVKQYIKNKIFIDAGGYIGDSALSLLSFHPRKIYSFEPSPSLFREMKKNIENNQISNEQIELFPYGLGSESASISFSDPGKGGTDLRRNGFCHCEIFPLDDFAKKYEMGTVGLIKADVEGMGLELVKGALKTIRNDRPFLSLSIYHNQDEFFGIYELLESMKLNYKFKIVSLCPWYHSEITLLAYPAELESKL